MAVRRVCEAFVRIPGNGTGSAGGLPLELTGQGTVDEGRDSVDGVSDAFDGEGGELDSLNVSVAAGILMYSLGSRAQ